MSFENIYSKLVWENIATDIEIQGKRRAISRFNMGLLKNEV